MTKIIVDTNIIFSALLNTNSRIGQILINGNRYCFFFAPEYIRFEIFKYKEKIKNLGNFTDYDFFESYELIIRNITILNHALIPNRIYQKAELLCENIDIDDTAFVAVSDYIMGWLWTGDKKLINGLKNNNYKRIITTEQLYEDFILKHKL